MLLISAALKGPASFSFFSLQLGQASFCSSSSELMIVA
jgi:hypothetical protein